MPVSPGSADPLSRARAARDAGRPGEALTLIRRHLRGHGEDAAAHHLAATLEWGAGARDAALAHAKKAARLAPRAYPLRLEYARMLVLAQDKAALAESEAALALRPDDPAALFEHARIVFNGPAPEDAQPLLEALAADLPEAGAAEAQAMLAALHIAAGRAGPALDAAETALRAGVRAPEIFEIRGRALLALNRPEDARLSFATALRGSPERLLSLRGYSVASAVSGRMKDARRAVAEHVRLLPFETVGGADAPLTMMVGNLLGRDGVFSAVQPDRAYGLTNHVSLLNLPDLRLVHYAPNYVTSAEIAERCGGAQLVFNNIANAELIAEGGGGARLAASYAETGLPVINAVENTELCTREGNYRRLKDDPNFIFPRTERFDTGDDPDGAARDMLARFDLPFMVRPVTTNSRQGLRVIRAPEELAGDGALSAHAAYYAIEFFESRMTCGQGDDGVLQYRASVVDGEVLPDRLVWNFGDFSAPAVDRQALDYDGRGLTEIEQTFLADPAALLGRGLDEIFGGMARTLGLDTFGIDFGVTPEGKVVVFEANAAMNLFNPKHDYYAPYRAAPREAFNEKVVNMLRRRAGLA